MNLHLPSSNLQLTMATALETFRRLYLQEALAGAIARLDLSAINAELDEFAPPRELKSLARSGLRGEFLYPVPCLLLENPRLLAYYRLLFGFSQKEFYSKAGLGRFKSMEDKGVLSQRAKPDLDALCRAFAERASEFVAHFGAERLTLRFLDDLTLLTVGPQLRGGNNTKIGKLANEAVFELIVGLAGGSVTAQSPTRIEITNAANRKVVVAFSSDPDICVTEETSSTSRRKIVAIEVKGGGDQSNIWNRLGEAEKSHQTARANGFVECWTIYNIPKLDLSKARQKSPSTNRFYNLQDLVRLDSGEFDDFRRNLTARLGISNAG